MKKIVSAILVGSLMVAGAQAQKPTAAKAAGTKATAGANKKATATKAEVTPFGSRLIERVNAQPGKVVIPYEKWVLPNGLTLIIHVDKSDPVAHVDVTYHVGSAREQIGKSGFAHFFEHMMFQGSDNVADEEHFKTVSAAGGTLNGTTNDDRTNYFETIPSNQVEVALWLESDRMGFLLDAVTQKKFEVQRATVKNERGQNVDNRPYGRVEEAYAPYLYPYGHPYSWPTIGFIEDLNRVDVNDLKNFFLRWYGPNNATLTVGGDVDPMQVLTMTEKYFGPIKRGPEVKKMYVEPVVLAKDKYVVFEDNIRFPLLLMTYPTVPNYHPDEPALDALSDILGGSQTSLMYKNFVKSQDAVQAAASHPCSELAGVFQLQILPYPNGTSLKEMEAKARETLVEFEKRGVTDEDIQRFKAKMEIAMIGGLETVSGKVSQLAAFQTFAGDPNRIGKEIARYNALTKEDVMRAYNKYIKGKHAVILSYVPTGSSELVAGNTNETPDKSNYKEPADEYKGMVYNKAKDSFDRSKKPAPGANPVVKTPDFFRNTLANGIKVIGAQSKELPMVNITVNLPGGHLLSQTQMNKAGIASLTASMLDESTEKYTTEEFSAELQKLGSSISINAGLEAMSVSITCLTKNLDKTIELARERMFKPRFDKDDFDRVRNQQFEAIENSQTQAATQASNLFGQLMYGKESIRSTPVLGTGKTVNSISLDDVKKFYASYWTPAKATAIIVGDLDDKVAQAKVEKLLGDWKGQDYTIPTLPEPKQYDKVKIFLNNKEKAPQSEIRVGYTIPDMTYSAYGDYYKANVMNFILGGAFNSRLNLNLREDKGWTYGARSGFRASELPATFAFGAGVKGQTTDSSIVEVMKEIKGYASDKPITQEELDFTKKSLGQQEALRYEGLDDKASFLYMVQRYNLDKDYSAKQNAMLQNMTVEDIKNTAQKYLKSDKMEILVVGDKAKVEEPLKKLGYEIVELDKQGNVIERPKPEPAPAAEPNKEIRNVQPVRRKK